MEVSDAAIQANPATVRLLQRSTLLRVRHAWSQDFPVVLFGKIEVRAAASACWLCTYFWNLREQIAKTFSGEKESNSLLSSAGAARSLHIVACRSLDQVAHPTPVCVPV